MDGRGEKIANKTEHIIVSQRKIKRSETLRQVMSNVSETLMRLKSNLCIYPVHSFMPLQHCCLDSPARNTCHPSSQATQRYTHTALHQASVVTIGAQTSLETSFVCSKCLTSEKNTESFSCHPCTERPRALTEALPQQNPSKRETGGRRGVMDYHHGPRFC